MSLSRIRVLRYSTWRLIFSGLLFVITYFSVLSQGAISSESMEYIVIPTTPQGISTQYIGAVEGNVGFDLADLQDLGINTYRIYGGMSRWEAKDDDGKYGWPSITEIKANPDLVNWDWWDTVMTYPPDGSDYWWSGNPDEVWQGSARTIFSSLKQANIRPVVTIRNVDNGWLPDWALQLNPPRTEADWNEWWEHVFATVYWLNVRNDYQVDDFEIHNEPNHRPQGWGGNQADYFELVKVAEDAIAHVYSTYLPKRTFDIHAPNTDTGSQWPEDTLAAIPTSFDSIGVHHYDWDISAYVQQVRSWMHGTIHERSPLWVSEWGTYTKGYDDLNFSLTLLQNMIRMSQPGESYVYGSHIFSLYDWGHHGGFEGLVNAAGDRRLSYYAFRMGIRALQGGREVLLTTGNNSDFMAIATQDNQGRIFLLVVNSSSADRMVKVSIPTSTPATEEKATIWEFSKTTLDEVVEETYPEAGSISLRVPAHAGRLILIKGTSISMSVGET